MFSQAPMLAVVVLYMSFKHSRHLTVIEVNLYKSSYKSVMKGWSEDLDEWAAS